MMERIPEAAARLALRRLIAAYLAIAGSVLLLPGRPSGWPVLLLLHGVGIALLLGAGPARPLTRNMAARWPRLAAGVSDWYALLLMPFLYLELGALNVAVHGGRYFDGTVMAWEEMLFGSQPSQEWASALPSPALSEALHFFYLSYYLIIYLPPLYLWLRGWGGSEGRASLSHSELASAAGPGSRAAARPFAASASSTSGAPATRRAAAAGSRRGDPGGFLAAHQHMLFTLMLVFLVHYLVFIVFPVQGPRYLFPPPGGELSKGFMYHLAHAILERGSSQGTAFPSSHVGVAFAQTALVFLLMRKTSPLLIRKAAPLLMRKAAPLLLVSSVGLALGAIYGGFHYGVDVVAGLVLGLLLFVAAPRVARVLGVDLSLRRPSGARSAGP
jgi:membrane-associated phospholipid phosphatase